MKELFLAADRRAPKAFSKPRLPERGDRQTLFGKYSRRKGRTLSVYYDIRAYSKAATRYEYLFTLSVQNLK